MEIDVDRLLKRRADSSNVRTMMQRMAEFPTELEAKLTGVALDPAARARMDTTLDETWSDSAPFDVNGQRFDEVIIGSGFHAAVYAANRVRAGYPKPLVLERSERVGGIFAQPGGAAFYLNSRNRAGGLGLAGDLGVNPNYLPGAPIQTANLSVGDYQTNDDMAFVIRMTLAKYANVVTGYEVNDIEPGGSFGTATQVIEPGGSRVRARRRIIDARGLGDPRDGDFTNGRNILTFPQLMQRMAGIWPLRGVKRAAVIGSGDAARCAIEALLGIGPQPPMSIPMLDTVERIDVYGDMPTTCERWAANERGRYAKIGRFLRADRFGVRRLNVMGRADRAVDLNDTALVKGRAYDLVVVATGNAAQRVEGLPLDFSYEDYYVGGSLVARQLGRFWKVGPAAGLPFTEDEESAGIADIDNNRVSMFRLASKTAALAATLPA